MENKFDFSDDVKIVFDGDGDKISFLIGDYEYSSSDSSTLDNFVNWINEKREEKLINDLGFLMDKYGQYNFSEAVAKVLVS
jgi:hypothetical protein